MVKVRLGKEGGTSRFILVTGGGCFYFAMRIHRRYYRFAMGRLNHRWPIHVGRSKQWDT